MWIARDKDGSLRMFLHEPYKDIDRYRSDEKYCRLISELFPKLTFDDGPIEVDFVSRKVLEAWRKFCIDDSVNGFNVSDEILDAIDRDLFN